MHSVLGYLLFLHPQGKTSPLISVENIADKSIRLLVVQENIQKSMSTCMNPWSTVATIYPLLVADLSFKRDQTDFKTPKIVWFYTHLVLVWELFNPPKKFVPYHIYMEHFRRFKRLCPCF